MGRGPVKFLIVTADDFGLHEAINEAVQQAAEIGVLTSASLMVGAPAAGDAIRRARTIPDLRVGLHIVLDDGRPVLPPDRIPGLVGTEGRFRDRMVVDAIRFVALPGVRRQLEAEIRAQFEAFANTGLKLDHVNTHKHFHLHPIVLGMILSIGREFGVTAVRIPREPLWLPHAVGDIAGLVGAVLLLPWLVMMKRRLRAAGIAFNDQVFGISCSGRMDERTMLAILARLPGGCTEIYLHPAVPTTGPITPTMRSYRHSDELKALLSARVRAAIQASKAMSGGYADFASMRACAHRAVRR
jgi:hopanoid biosynthesis associated protein HpnK